MPHSTFNERPHPFNSGTVKCPCGQTFNYASERDWYMKLCLHSKVCPKPPEGSKPVRMPKKAMTLREKQQHEAEMVQRVHKHHYQYPFNLDRYYHF